MRVRLRVFGRDVIELATGSDLDPPAESIEERGPGVACADLQPAPRFGYWPADDEPRIFPDD